MKPEIESRYRRSRDSSIAGAAAIMILSLAATPALADVVIQRTTSYANPPAIAVETPAPVVVPAPAPTVTYTYQAAPTTYVERTETVTIVPAPPVTREVTVEVVEDTPKYDYTVHKRVQTTHTQARAAQHKPAARCTCQPSQ